MSGALRDPACVGSPEPSTKRLRASVAPRELAAQVVCAAECRPAAARCACVAKSASWSCGASALLSYSSEGGAEHVEGYVRA